ncbi:conserved Plasmodium protein, unknown function [Plasmodium vinckei vinckei]|uniref:CKK domain-containing protein n=1 Tax=Plasmodium vinckei vinckei TaxID=54757 RepID=A0A449BYD8_PLAVN|nr:conserved Plasmodium protein, unknown function [Plasmodium vinckei vinckei]VEV58453.1 conserved Plasmodium protein, unknown function [Plasmodium vinckei vinckei]
MNKNDENEQTPKNTVYKIHKKKFCKNKINKECPFYVNYDILVKNYKNEKNYIDLNLEINYNLEEIEENNENIKKCIFIANEKNKGNLGEQKASSKNDKINNQHETNYNIDSINNFISSKHKKKGNNPNCENRESSRRNQANIDVSSEEERKTNIDKNKSKDNIKNNNNHEYYSSDSNGTYCSDLSDNYSEIEKKSMNFSQRITYDDIIPNKINLYDTTIDLNSHKNNKNKSKNNNKNKNDIDDISYGVTKLKPSISNDSSLLFDDSNNESFNYAYNVNSSSNYNRSDSNNTEFYSSNIFSKQHKYPFLDKLYCSKEEERNKYNNLDSELVRERSSPIRLQFNKKDKILNRRKSEDDILNKYEKIIKIMKYLRRIKTRHPEIETIVSILSNNIKNVTFNCEKMFSSRRELNDFLKKIYIYQIYLLKKVVFKKNYSSKKDHIKNPSMQKVSFVNINQSHLRDHSEIPDDTKRDSNYLLYYLSKNPSFNVPNNLLYENSDVNKDHSNRQNSIDMLGNIHKYIDLKRNTKDIENKTYYDRKNDGNKKNNNKSSDYSDEEQNYNYKQHVNKINENKKKSHRHNINSNNAFDKVENCQEKRDISVKPRKNHILNIKNELANTEEIYTNDYNNSNTFANPPLNECNPNNNFLKRVDNEKDRHMMDDPDPKETHGNSNFNIIQKGGEIEKNYMGFKKGLNMNALNLENKCDPIKKNVPENDKCPNTSIDKDKLDKKTYVLYYDVNKEIYTISNRDSVTHALKTTLLNSIKYMLIYIHVLTYIYNNAKNNDIILLNAIEPQNFTALQNFLFKIEVELVEYKHFILLITKNFKKVNLEALYGLNDFSVFEKVYGKKIAPRFLVSQKVKMFYKYDILYHRFKELENVRAFSGIIDAVELI